MKRRAECVWTALAVMVVMAACAGIILAPLTQGRVHAQGGYGDYIYITFEDDFEDAGYTADSWFIWSPTWHRVAVPGGMAFEGCGGSAPPNVGPEALACAARGRSFMVDGLYVRTSLNIVSLGGGIVFGANECVAEVPPLRDATYQTYYVAVSPLIGGIELHEIGSGFDNALAAASIPGLSYDMWYDLELVSTDTNFQVWFGLKGGPLDKVIDVAQDVLHPGTQTYLSGLVDLWVENSADTDSRVQFDDFVVEGIEEAARSMMTGNVGTIPGTPASVSMSVTDAEGVAGFQFDLYYHTGWLPALIAPYVEKGSLIASDPSWQVSYSVLGPGHISVLGSNTLAQPLPPGAWGELARMWFQVNPGLSNEAALLDIENATLSDRYGDPIAVKPYDGLAYIKEAPLTFLDPGYSASVFYSGIPRPDGIAPQPDGSLLVVQENDPNSGVVLAREGDTYDLGDAYSTLGNPFTGPDDIVLGPDGIAYVSNGYPIQGILKVLPGGGEPAWLAPSPPVTDAYGLAFAPPGFLGPNVKPGDLLIADNGLGNPAWWGLFSADLSTGEVRKIAGNFENGPLQVEVGPDGTVYVAENDDPRNGYSIDVVAPNGTVTPLLANFDTDGVPDEMDRGPMAANPVTNKLYFADSNSGNMWVLDNGVPRLFAWGLDEPQNCAFSADGSTLFVSEISSHRIIRIDGFGPRHLSAAHRVGVPGSAVSVPIRVNDTTAVAAAQIDLRYDPAILTATVVQPGDLIAGDSHWQLFSRIDAGRAQAIIFNDQAVPLAGGGGSLVEMTFQVNPAAIPGQVSPLTLAKHLLSDSLGNELPSQGQDGSVAVIAVHHFAFDPISSPQGGDPTNPLPFSVTIRALDQNGQPAAYYTGTATLSDLTGTVQPTTVGPFVGGIWTGDVTIGAARAADVLHVQDASGHFGDSNPFDVIVKGSVNGDQETNVLDVMRTVNIILGYLAPDPWQSWAADMNNDGEVNVQDIILIINQIFASSSTGGAQALALSARVSAEPVVVSTTWTTSAAGNPVLQIRLSDAAGVAGAQVDVTYNPKRVRDVVARGGGLLAGSDWQVHSANRGGAVRVLAFSGSARGLAAGKGSIVELEFAATGKGNLADIAAVTLTDAAGNAIPVQIGPAKPGGGKGRK